MTSKSKLMNRNKQSLVSIRIWLVWHHRRVRVHRSRELSRIRKTKTVVLRMPYSPDISCQATTYCHWSNNDSWAPARIDTVSTAIMDSVTSRRCRLKRKALALLARMRTSSTSYSLRHSQKKKRIMIISP